MRNQKSNNRQQQDDKKRKILFVDDDTFVLESLTSRLRDVGFEVVAVNNGADAIIASKQNFDVIIADIRMPEIDGIQTLEQVKQIAPKTKSMLLTAFADNKAPLRAIHVGVDDYLMKPVEDDTFLERVKNLIIRKAIEEAAQEHYKAQQNRLHDVSSIIGNSEPLVRVLQEINEVADKDISVLLIGETGTGKELAAQAIHSHSHNYRHQHHFIAVNCAAITETLAEEEFFGHERGAFTNANNLRIGKFELAHLGTLFLDELGKLSYGMQDKLLRVLETKRFWRLGGQQEIQSDVRVIAAAQNIDSIEKEIYHRFLKTIYLPPLRERREDIPLLAMHFIEKYNIELKKHPEVTNIEDSALKLLQRHDWEGNVRELRNVIGCAVMSAPDGVIQVEDLRFPQPTNSIVPTVNRKNTRLKPIRVIIKEHIKLVLSECSTKTEAAKVLEMPLATLNDWIKRFEVE